MHEYQSFSNDQKITHASNCQQEDLSLIQGLSHPARPKARSSPRVKGIVVDGVISRDNGVVDISTLVQTKEGMSGIC